MFRENDSMRRSEKVKEEIQARITWWRSCLEAKILLCSRSRAPASPAHMEEPPQLPD